MYQIDIRRIDSIHKSFLMGKKKIQKAPKDVKADEDNHSASDHEPEPAQEP